MPGHQQSGRRQPAVLGQPVGEGFGWYWPTEEVPLADITAECLQLGPDGLGLDPFGHHRDAELVSEVDGGADNGAEARTHGDRADQGPVELKLCLLYTSPSPRD